MKNSTTSAFPHDNDNPWYYQGLTKREYFAGLAMQSMIATWAREEDQMTACAKLAINAADALLKQLDAAADPNKD